MRYNTYINTVKCMEWGLNANQGALFDLLNQLSSWAQESIVGDAVFYHISRNKIIEELPLFYSKPDTVYRNIKKLEEIGLIEYLKEGKKDLVKLTEKGKEWNSEINPNLGNKSEKTRNEIRKNSDLNPTNNITSNNTTNNNKEHMSVSELTDVPDWWNGLADNYKLTKIRMLSKTRKSKLKQRIKSIGSYDFFKETVEDAIKNSPFLQGENKQGWKCDFDFILQESSFIKMVEGKYNGQRRLTETEKRIEAFKKLREARA